MSNKNAYDGLSHSPQLLFNIIEIPEYLISKTKIKRVMEIYLFPYSNLLIYAELYKQFIKFHGSLKNVMDQSWANKSCLRDLQLTIDSFNILCNPALASQIFYQYFQGNCRNISKLFIQIYTYVFIKTINYTYNYNYLIF